MNSFDFAIFMVKPHVLSALIMIGLYALLFGPRFYRKISKGSLDSGYKNVALAILNSVLVFLFFGWLAYISQALYDFGIPHLPASIWDGFSLPASFVVALLCFDFANYWAHRLLHTRLFWGTHTLHHSDKHMNWTTAMRVHILEYVLMAVLVVVMVGWLQIPVEAAALAGVTRLWYSHYLHCQLGWSHGRFDKVLASPNYHRWHHAKTPESQGKNLSDMFPIWDLAFGTYYNPGPCLEALGVDGAPQNFFAELAHPFVYWLQGAQKHFAWLTSRLRSAHVKSTDKTLSVPE